MQNSDANDNEMTQDWYKKSQRRETSWYGSLMF